MAKLSLPGKVLLPDSSVPSGYLTFLDTADYESSASLLCRRPELFGIGTSCGDVTPSLEALRTFDVSAVLHDYNATFSLGRWTIPSTGYLSTPLLFDAWKSQLTHPADHLLLSLRCMGATYLTPIRSTVNDVGPVTYGTYGRTLDAASRFYLSAASDSFLPGAGTLIVKAYSTWAGNDSADHGLFSGITGGGATGFAAILKLADNNLYIATYDAAGDRKGSAYAVDATSMPANSEHVYSLRWNAGTIKAWLDSTNLAISGPGTGVISDCDGLCHFGIASAVTWGGELSVVKTYDYSLTDGELTAEIAAL